MGNADSTSSPTNFLAVDIGNSSIKFALMLRNDIQKVLRLATPADEAAFGEWVEQHLSKSVDSGAQKHRCAIASVSPGVTERIRGPLEEFTGSAPIVLGVDQPIPIENRTKRPEQVGIDRLVNALAARESVGKPSIVVDFGSAVTFDIVSEEGAYLGGVITPGIELALKALADNTALLPLVKPEGRPHIIGKDTVSAINSGVYHGYVGLVRNVIKEIRSELGRQDIPVVATGGDGAYLAEDIPEINEVLPNLTMLGIRLACDCA